MNKNVLVERQDTLLIVVTNPKKPGIISASLADKDLVAQHNWHINGRGYVACGIGGKTILMHRLILGFPPGVDHKDGNQLNNTRNNLRLATGTQNMGNRRMNRNNKTGYRGVQVFRDRYRVFLGKKYIGVFMNKDRAAKAYDKAALDYFGEFARLNFPG